MAWLAHDRVKNVACPEHGIGGTKEPQGVTHRSKLNQPYAAATH